ncbi:MAG: 3-deoxy-D-manno-octulosonic acid kinase [Proteobacteria bacterium]|nr:3-deoxy-D-manno-octulosonic acid kinase [Pseudomonadota bacterium]
MRTVLQRQKTADGAILFDASVAGQAEFDARWFEAAYWRAENRATAEAGGRGGIIVAHAPQGDWVLRHCHRGGLVARVMGDRYLWSGEETTRSFVELRLLHELALRDLDAPRPIAARYRRSGSFYRADLISAFIAEAATLARCVSSNTADAAIAQRVGSAVARFHAEGVYHADLNAHNILVGAEKIWLIDFDRGELRVPESGWRHANLARLRRSLIKIGAGGSDEAAWDANFWRPLIFAYEIGFETSAKETNR